MLPERSVSLKPPEEQRGFRYVLLSLFCCRTVATVAVTTTPGGAHVPTLWTSSTLRPTDELQELGPVFVPRVSPMAGCGCSSAVPLLSLSTTTTLTQSPLLPWTAVALAYWASILPFHPSQGSKGELLRNTGQTVTAASLQPPAACKRTHSVSSWQGWEGSAMMRPPPSTLASP